MGKFDHHFIPFDPAPASKEELAGLTDLHRTVYRTQGGHDLWVRFIGDRSGARVICVTVPDDARSYANLPNCLKQIVENAVTAIRLSYDHAASPIFTGDGFLSMMLTSDEEFHGFPMVVRGSWNDDFVLNVDNMAGTFGAISRRGIADVAALMAEAQVPSLPPHYGVLSLLRAIELLWPLESDRNAILDKYESSFAGLQISQRRFRNALPEIRNRCAHGQGRGAPEPFVGIGFNEPSLRPLAYLLCRVAADGVKAAYGLELTVRST